MRDIKLEIERDYKGQLYILAVPSYNMICFTDKEARRVVRRFIWLLLSKKQGFKG